VFRDPRRFGGLWCFETFEALEGTRWSRLGPDALAIDAATLAKRLNSTRRAIKAALLDQKVIAGVGNIYADEILHAARVDPRSASNAVSRRCCRALAAATRRILSRAIDAGGSTVRDFLDGRGRPGSFSRSHRVYGRAGLPCFRCGRRLQAIRLAQRQTVYCPVCQRLVL
jgi:formamidopyrimidine-DNA glycosylase